MKIFEILCADRNGQDKRVHVVANDEGDAVIEFRSEYSLDEWTVECLHEIIKPAVIEVLNN